MSDKNSTHTLKPALRAFPKTWLWITWHSAVAIFAANAGNLALTMDLLIYAVLPPVLLIVLYRYGRSYTINGDRITLYNRFGGKTECFSADDIVNLSIKPIVLGAMNLEIHLINGRKIRIKNIVPKTKLKFIQQHCSGML